MRFPVERPVVFLVGPTAVGKTALALALALELDAEIISADSRLFYRGMNIGTAKPAVEEMRRVPHHLVDVADPWENWSLALFQREAKDIIERLHEHGKLPLVVGGTGQYVRALTEGWQVPAQQPQPVLRKTLEHWAVEVGAQGLHDRLAVLDPDAAQNIDARNQRRTLRALEVILMSGQRFSRQRTRQPLGYHLKMIGLRRGRVDLYARVDARIEAMLADGLVQEVRGLLESGCGPDLPSMSAIGYGEICRYLQGELSLEEALILIKRRTRQFVRRQANWFKESDPAILWFDIQPGVEAAVRDYILSETGWQFDGD